MTEGDDTGDPQLANAIWLGRYETLPATGATTFNNGILLTKQLIVQFCGDYTVTTEGICTLPDDLKPSAEMRYPVCIDDEVGYVIIHVDGSVTASKSGTIYLNGTGFHLCGKYYTEVGNG